jgi:alkylglycerol monooxygenase
MSVNYIALAVPFFFLLIGVELLIAWRTKRRLYRLNDAVTDMSCGIGQQVTGAFLMGVLVAGYGFVYERWAIITFEAGSIVPWIVAFLGVDLAYYWWHRFSHEVAFMWAVHVVHHQSEDYNLAVALRQAWFSGLTSSVFYLPLAFLGIPPLVFFTVAAFSTLYQFWIHTRVIGKLGPFEWVFNTPSQHRVHHGRDAKYLDRNYAATLCVWDRVFGSFQEEEEEPLYGTIAPYASWNPVWANFDFWAHLVKKARGTPRLSDKLRVFVKSPGWVPPGGVEHDGTPRAVEPAVRYETTVPFGLKVYVAAQFLVVLAATMNVYALQRSEDRWLVACLVAGILVTTVVLGGLFERRSWALGLEFVRLGVLASVVGVLFASGVLGAAAAIGAFGLLAAFTSWLAVFRSAFAPSAPAPATV